jgi:predicted nucleic acid-binding protein
MQARPVTIAIDTSAILAVLLNEPSRSALIAMTGGGSLIAAPSLPWEIGNALIAGVRRHRLTNATVQEAWASYGRIPIRLVPLDVAKALELAASLGIYAYDAYVLEAARSARAPLLTLDGALTRAARAIGVGVMEIPR